MPSAPIGPSCTISHRVSQWYFAPMSLPLTGAFHGVYQQNVHVPMEGQWSEGEDGNVTGRGLEDREGRPFAIEGARDGERLLLKKTYPDDPSVVIQYDLKSVASARFEGTFKVGRSNGSVWLAGGTWRWIAVRGGDNLFDRNRGVVTLADFVVHSQTGPGVSKESLGLEAGQALPEEAMTRATHYCVRTHNEKEVYLPRVTTALRPLADAGTAREMLAAVLGDRVPTATELGPSLRPDKRALVPILVGESMSDANLLRWVAAQTSKPSEKEYSCAVLVRFVLGEIAAVTGESEEALRERVFTRHPNLAKFTSVPPRKTKALPLP